jgi:hypothetical protein
MDFLRILSIKTKHPLQRPPIGGKLGKTAHRGFVQPNTKGSNSDDFQDQLAYGLGDRCTVNSLVFGKFATQIQQRQEFPGMALGIFQKAFNVGFGPNIFLLARGIKLTRMACQPGS